MSMPFADSNSVRRGDDGSVLRTTKNSDQKTDDDLSATSKLGKRKACLPDGSRDRPIVIDDSVVPTKRTDSDQGPLYKKHRINERSHGRHEKYQAKHELTNGCSRLGKLLQSSQKIVVISGAGISANAGFPTFQEIRKSKQTSFDCSSVEAIGFHSTICNIFAHVQSDSCQPTPFHIGMDKTAREHRLLCHITQNFDCMEQRFPDLDARTIRLHGRVDQVRCQECHSVRKFEPTLFQGNHSRHCGECVQRSQARVSRGKRALKIGRLRPNVLLYGEPHPDEENIIGAVNNNLAKGPDLVLVVGTQLRVPGALSIATSFCYAARDNGGVTVWISKEEPSSKLRSLFDYIFKGDCDEVTWSSPQPSTLIEIPTRDKVAVPPLISPPKIHSPSLQQLGAYDDILTDTLVDLICYSGVTRKYCSAYHTVCEDQQRVISILQDVVIQGKDLPEAERRLLLLPKLKRFSDNLKSAAERDAFQRHMRRYLNLYLPDCAFEISSTNRYTLTRHEAAIISRKLIRKGDEIKYLNGIRVHLTTEEEDDLDLKGTNFSMVITTRKKDISFFFGPGRFANHDCKANARLTTTGTSGIKIIATRDIGIGEEITVGYDDNYFEENNCECLCKTCEERCQNGWTSENQIRVNDSPKSSFRYPFRHCPKN